MKIINELFRIQLFEILQADGILHYSSSAIKGAQGEDVDYLQFVKVKENVILAINIFVDAETDTQGEYKGVIIGGKATKDGLVNVNKIYFYHANQHGLADSILLAIDNSFTPMVIVPMDTICLN